MDNDEKRRTYESPSLTLYGELLAITAGISCSQWNKIGPDSDDVTGTSQGTQGLTGDPTCI